MKVVWQKKEIPTSWQRAGGILIPERSASSVRSALYTSRKKIFFSVVHKLAGFLQRNNLIDISIQRARISGFSGCVDASVIWYEIQVAKREGKDLHVVFLDLANAFGSVPHNLLWTAFDYFRVPPALTTLVKAHFQDIQVSLLNPLEVSWVNQQNTHEGGRPLDNPKDVITHLNSTESHQCLRCVCIEGYQQLVLHIRGGAEGD